VDALSNNVMKKSFEDRFKVYAHELGPFLWAAGIFVAVFFITAIFRNYVDTTFLKRYGVEEIPLMLVINGFLTIAVLGVMNRLGERFSDYQLLVGFLAGYGLVAALLYFLVDRDITIAYALLFQMLHLLDSVFLVYLWNIACDLFDARQGKRLFPLLTACQVLGTTIGNFSTGWLAHAVGQHLPLMVFSPSCLVISAAPARSAATMMPCPRQRTVELRTNRKKPSEIPAILKKYPMVRYLCILGLIPNMLLPIFAYQFNVIADRTFASESSLITFLSYFRGGMTLVVFFSLLLMPHVYGRLGMVNASLVYPVNFSLVFHALWVHHADMGLVYEALRSTEATAAVELVEATLDRDLAKYVIPLIDNIPPGEKVRLGQRILPVMRASSPERVRARLAGNRDSTTRMLTAYTMGEHFPDAVFIPALEELLDDEERDVRTTAAYALKRCQNEEARMPEVIELINQLHNFMLFDGMGIKELRAIASIVLQETFQPGEILMREGEDNSSLYLLVQGQVKLYRNYGPP